MLWSSYHYKLLALAQQSSFLTPSQQDTFRLILEFIHDREQRINLWGNPGVGKTFVAHYLDYQAEGLYACSIKNHRTFEFSPNSIVIFDNAIHERKAARLIFGDLLWAGAATVILITRNPINDAVRKVNLSLTIEDIEQFKKNVHKQLGISIVESLNHYQFQQTGLWALIKHITMLNNEKKDNVWV